MNATCLKPKEIESILDILTEPKYDAQRIWIDISPITEDDFSIPVDLEKNNPFNGHMNITLGTNYCSETHVYNYTREYEPTTLFENELKEKNRKLYDDYLISLKPEWDWKLDKNADNLVYVNKNRIARIIPSVEAQQMIEKFNKIKSDLNE